MIVVDPQKARGEALDCLKCAGLEDLDQRLELDGYLLAPASKGHHLACVGGLAAHSVNVTKRLVEITRKLRVRWSGGEASAYRVGMLHDLVKVACYERNVFKTYATGGRGEKIAEIVRDDGFKYRQPVWPGHGVASVMIATVEYGVVLNPDEAAAITYHMGAFGLSGRSLEELDAALCWFPAQIIATHTADMLAARIDEPYEIGGEA